MNVRRITISADCFRIAKLEISLIQKPLNSDEAFRVSDGEVVFDINEIGLDLWRGESSEHFVRPKWGIYRSIVDLENLRAEEEYVQFANFSIAKVSLTD